MRQYQVEIPTADYWRRQIKCQDACPVNTDARGYVRAIADGDGHNDMVQDLILNRRSAQEITRAAQETGRLRILKEDAADKAVKGITTLEEAAFAVMS